MGKKKSRSGKKRPAKKAAKPRRPSKTARKKAKAKKKAGRATVTKTARRSKPVKGITKRDLPPFRRKLLQIRKDLLRKVQLLKHDVDMETDTGDEADQASRSIEKEIFFELSDNERQMLDQTEAALRKMDNGTYGSCELCRKPIGKERMKALPFARYCISCQSRSETLSF